MNAVVTIPVMAALDGQNYFHDSIEWMWTQGDCVSILAGLTLLKLGLNESEIDNFKEEKLILEMRLAWYCQRSASVKATTIPDFANETCKLPIIEMRAGAAQATEKFVQTYTEVYTCPW